MTMKVGDKPVTFHWSNYAKPTPKNLLGLAAAFRRMVTLITGASIIMDAKPWVPIAVLIVGGLLDELKNFFASVVEDAKTESTTAEFPSGDTVTITKDQPPSP